MPQAAMSAANNDVSMGLTTDGSARIDTVPPQLDLAQANPETKNTERADESGNTVAFESSTDKYLW